MSLCDQELCPAWTGEGCACAVMSLERQERCQQCGWPTVHGECGQCGRIDYKHECDLCTWHSEDVD